MTHIERWKAILILAICLLGFMYALPNTLSAERLAQWQATLPSFMPTRTVNLGLDLRGGSHLLLEVKMDSAVSDRAANLVDSARTELRKENIGYIGGFATIPNGITFTLRDPTADRDRAYKIARNLDEGLEVDISAGGKVTAQFMPQQLTAIKDRVMGQSIEIVRRRIDESGTREPIIQRQGADRIVVQLPGVDDPGRVKALLGKTAKMTFQLVDEDFSSGTMNKADLASGSQILPMSKDERQGGPATIAVRKRAVLTGDMLVDSQPSFDQGMPIVSFRFNKTGARKFCETTRENVGKPFAIVLDGEVISAPVIRDAICGGSGIISGNFTVKEAQDLSLLLRAGALPAPIQVVEERSVGPTLGADSVEAGKKACIMALVFVALLACTVYGVFGVFASIALLVNMTILFAIMSILQATLTLPGIAGIVLTIGLAVDANVLIFERVKEELRAGRSLMPALDVGYTRALTTIIDSNLSALIAALILFSFGTGPIKGFAVTMCIGVVTSYFCAVMLTRLMVISFVRWRKIKEVAV